MRVDKLIQLLQTCPGDYKINVSVDISNDLGIEEELRAFGTEVLETMCENKVKIVTLITTGNINFEELLIDQNHADTVEEIASCVRMLIQLRNESSALTANTYLTKGLRELEKLIKKL